MAKPNKQRGEVTIEGPGGEEYKLCLTLGAIAQIEDELGLESLADIDEVLEKPSMKHVLKIFVALLNGGGHTDVTTQDMIAWNVKLPELMRVIRESFSSAGFSDNDDEEEGDVPPKK